MIHNAFSTVNDMFLNNCKAFLGDEHRKREHDFFDAFEGIRGLPPGRARLRKWRPSHALEASGVALTWP